MNLARAVRSRRALSLACAASLLGIGWAVARAENPPRNSPGPSASGCVQCHRFEPGLTHPVNVKPQAATPAAFPLEDGRVTCLTCHDASPQHASARTPVGVRGEGSLCIQCHKDASPRTRAIHAVSTGKAHLIPGNSARSTPVGLDDESKNCMACHDGAAASDAGSHGFRLDGGGPAADHPIGIPMRASKPAGESDFKLASPASLDRRVRLFGGAVGCGSCHSVYSAERSKLAVTNIKSQLCLKCHTQ